MPAVGVDQAPERLEQRAPISVHRQVRTNQRWFLSAAPPGCGPVADSCPARPVV